MSSANEDEGRRTDITDNEFKEFLDLNKIIYAKAECLKSKKDGRVLQMFRFEINNPTKSEALISQNLVCQATGIVYEVQEKPNVLIERGHMLHLTKGVRNTKNRHLGNMWSITKKHMPPLSAKTLFCSLKP